MVGIAVFFSLLTFTVNLHRNLKVRADRNLYCHTFKKFPLCKRVPEYGYMDLYYGDGDIVVELYPMI